MLRKSHVGAIVATGLTVCGMVRSGLGDILYAGTQSGPVDRVSSAGVVSTFARLPPGGVYPSGLAFDRAGNLFAADLNANQVDTISPAGVAAVFKSLPAGSHPEGLAFDLAGNLYVANQSTHEINRLTAGGVLSHFATLPANSSPAGLAFDAGGNLYAADTNNDRVLKITPAGAVTPFATLPSGSAPFGVAFDAADNLYAADFLTDEVSKITAGGTVSRFASLPANAQAIGLAFDSAGNLYEGGIDNEIRRISRSGTVTPFAGDTSANGFTYIAFTDDAGRPLALPVLEPGDANADGRVDFADLLILAQHYGKAGGLSAGDFDADGTVAFPDLLILAQHYGQGAAPTVTAVPETSVIGLVAAAPLLLARRRRRAARWVNPICNWERRGMAPAPAPICQNKSNRFLPRGLWNLLPAWLGLILSGAALAGNLPTYHVTDLGFSGGLLTGINDYGQVVGWTAQDVTRPFVWTPTEKNGTSGSVTVPDGLFRGAATDAWAINDSGQLVGRSDSKAVLWNPVSPNSGTFGQPVALAQPGGPDLGIALGINAAGQVTGNTKGVGNQAFLFTPTTPNGTAGSVIQLGTLAPSKISFGSDINDYGQVAGTSFGAFVWTPTSPHATGGTLTRLSPELDSEQVRVAINNSGSIAGPYARPDGLRAFLWTPGTPNGSSGSYVDLGTLGSGSRMAANDVNDNNEVVGGFGQGEGGFVWTPDSGIKDLNTLLDASAAERWNILTAFAVNNAGQIGANAVLNQNGTIVDHFVLLTPDDLLARPGDANGDGAVNFADLLILAQNYGKTPGQTVAQGDFNNDGGVGFDDLLILAQNYGQGAAAAVATVPEPSGFVALAVAPLLIRRRRGADTQ